MIGTLWNWLLIKTLHNTYAFFVNKYFLILGRGCSLKLTWRKRFSMCSMKLKLLSVVIPNNATLLVSWIAIELIFKVIILRFFFAKIMVLNFLGCVFKELILSHFSYRVSVSSYLKYHLKSVFVKICNGIFLPLTLSGGVFLKRVFISSVETSLN